MAEIKSAIEIAMERTKNLVMDQKEKEALARRDLEDKLRAITRRYMEGIVDRDTFLAEYADTAPQNLDKGKMLADVAIAEFDVSAENERLFDILEIVGQEAGQGLVTEAKTLKTQFRKELESRITGVKARIKDRLEAMGIDGSAVEPNVVEWREWKDAVQEIGGLFKRRLYEWKDRINTVQGAKFNAQP